MQFSCMKAQLFVLILAQHVRIHFSESRTRWPNENEKLSRPSFRFILNECVISCMNQIRKELLKYINKWIKMRINFQLNYLPISIESIRVPPLYNITILSHRNSPSKTPTQPGIKQNWPRSVYKRVIAKVSLPHVQLIISMGNQRS